MDTNKHESVKNREDCCLEKIDALKVVSSILEHTTQNSLQMLKTEPLRILKNALSCFSCLSWLKNISVHWCPFVVPNSLSVSSVCSVVQTGGAR